MGARTVMRGAGPALAAGFGLALVVAVPARAEIAITVARITDGYLWVAGQANETNARVTLDDALEERTDSRGRFEFRVVYHPATCIVTLKTEIDLRRAVIANCGQAGPKGDPGLAGPPGPAGPQGPAGPTANRAVAYAGELAPPPPARPVPPPPLRPTSDASTPPAPSAALQAPEAPKPVDPPRPKPPEKPPAPPPPPAAGEWFVEDGVARVSIQPCGTALCGSVVWSKDGGGVGTQILRTMKPAGQNRWEGTILDPTTGKTYNSTISLQGPDALEVKGCVLGILCGGQTWTRAK